MLDILIILIIMCASIAILKKVCCILFGYNNVQGVIGETIVKFIINTTKEESDYYVINDLRLTTPTGRKAQIDHVVINSNGIFVIETKNYQGKIYGNDFETDWVQISKRGRKNYFYSPVKQNNTHIERICEYIPGYLPIYSIVVFVKCNTKNINSNVVVTPFDLKSIIENHQNPQLTHEEIVKTYNTLKIHNEK